MLLSILSLPNYAWLSVFLNENAVAAEILAILEREKENRRSKENASRIQFKLSSLRK